MGGLFGLLLLALGFVLVGLLLASAAYQALVLIGVL